MLLWVKVLLPIAGGVATIWAIAHLLTSKMTIQYKVDKVLPIVFK